VRVFERLDNHRYDALSVREDVVIPKPQHTPALLFEPRGPLSVDLFAVLAAIGLDDQSVLCAREVDDEAANGMLAAEPVSAQSPVA
jgi:hypothetical protein